MDPTESGHQVIRSSGHQEQKPVVVHCSESFVAVTENWIYHQVVGSTRYRPIVATERRENADQFPFTGIICPEKQHPAYRALCVPVRRNRLAVPLQALSRAFERPVRAVRPALIHAHFGTQAVHLLRLRRRLGVPLITTFYGYDAGSIPSLPGWRGWYRRLFVEGDQFLVEGSAFRRRLLELGCPPEKATVQHLGVDLAAIPFQPRQPSAPGESVRVLMAASFREKKGHEFALRAFAAVKAAQGSRLRAQGSGLRAHGEGRPNPASCTVSPAPSSTREPCTVSPEPPLQLRLIGDGELRSQIEALIGDLGLRDSVVLLGSLPHAEFLREALRCHLFLAPSVTASDGDTEGGAPVGVIEASATGMPVVASRHADIPEVVRHGESGWLAPERDVEALAEHLTGLIEHPERWPEMGKRGRRHIETEYNLRVQARRLDAIYDEVRGESRRRAAHHECNDTEACGL